MKRFVLPSFSWMIFGVNFLKVVDGNMGVNLGGFQGLVTEHLLEVTDGGSVFKHVCGTGMAERVGGYVLF